ncbi:putative LOC729966 homolog [Rhinophrynus dorsalis]
MAGPRNFSLLMILGYLVALQTEGVTSQTSKSTSVQFNSSITAPRNDSTWNSTIQPVSGTISYTTLNTNKTVNSTTHLPDDTRNVTTYNISSTVYYPKSTESSNITDTSNPVNGTANPVSETLRDMTENPGLVAVICIFASILCITFVVMGVKFCQKQEPEFQKLDEVPMNGMNEEAPFARYPPK